MKDLYLFEHVSNGNAAMLRMPHTLDHKARQRAGQAFNSSNVLKRCCMASIQICRRASYTFFSTIPLLPARGNIAEVGIEQIVCRHGKEACIDNMTVTSVDLVHGSLHVVVDAAPGNTPQREKLYFWIVYLKFVDCSLLRSICNPKGTFRLPYKNGYLSG